MDLIGSYADDGDDSGSTPTVPSSTTSSIVVNLAPQVPVSLAIADYKVDPHAKQISYNATYDAMWAPVQSVARPFEKTSIQSGAKNHLTGFVENHNMNDFTFKEQFYTFHNYGFASDPATNTAFVTNTDGKNIQENLTVYNSNHPNNEKRKRQPAGIPGTETYLGPWAPYEETEEVEVGLSEEQRKIVEEAMDSRKRQKGKAQREAHEAEEKAEESGGTSIFHGKELKDYQGRSYVDPPTTLKNVPHDAFLPKKWLHTWSGHSKGVSAARFFPKFGHLILSASMDEKVKIWDVYNNQKCLRTFMGHSKAVRDVCWSNDGRRFLSCGYDRSIKLWDSETGQCISTYSNNRIPYCVKFNPDEDKQHLFVTGGSDKKIIQWDTNSKRIVQEYDQHLGAVNTITFVDNNRRFVTSSDDKSLRVWEWGIPVVIKYISEPHMHSMPAVTAHPNGNWIACQSLDNQILIYSTKDRFKLHKKKRFMGHTVAGYACQITFSPDGKYLASGDGSGRTWFWDWKSAKLLKTIRSHDQVSIGCEWHPIEPSRVATCSWDGTIKYWD